MARRKIKDETAKADDGAKKSPMRHDKTGGELLDPTPMQPPLGYKRTPTLSEQIRIQVHQMKLDMLTGVDLEETDDEADDFEIGEDFEPTSPHENDHIPPIAVLKARVKEYNLMIEEANRRAAIAAHENAIKKPAAVTSPAAQLPPDKVESK